jgi:hypothetical protein
MANKMIEMSEILRDNMTKDELIPAASLVVTLGVILAGGYLMSYLVKIEEENVQKTLGAKGLKVRCFIKFANVIFFILSNKILVCIRIQQSTWIRIRIH